MIDPREYCSLHVYTESDDNANLSSVPGGGNLSNIDRSDITVGTANELNSTIASISNQASSGSSDSIP